MLQARRRQPWHAKLTLKTQATIKEAKLKLEQNNE
jgi:hypothetical protein